MGLIGCVGLPEAPWLISILRTSLMLVDFDRDPKHCLWSFSHWRLIIRLRLVIRWIIRARQIIRLNMKMERF